MTLTLSVPSKPLEYRASSCASRLPECAAGTGVGPIPYTGVSQMGSKSTVVCTVKVTVQHILIYSSRYYRLMKLPTFWTILPLVVYSV